jgi:adenine-specific DNA-methyltransferase
MEKLKMYSPNLTQDNVARIRELFPSCVSEVNGEDGALKLTVDFDQLRQELSESIVDGPQERYHLNWPGKREALLTANAPIAKTLRPCREESVDFDTTKNVFIEGDNLDALKLLQETYLGKVKLIYIDPPYNTGNDFVYDDDFAEEASAYLKRSNQTDDSGNRLVANTTANGRFHSDWLSMVYSRLRLARMLMSDDGVIVASIDENEVTNLRKLLDEVFGEDNLLFQITLLCNPKGRSQDKYVANCHEYLIGYSKHQLNKGDINVPKEDDEIESNYKLIDVRGRYRELELRNTHREFGKHNRKNLYYPFFVGKNGSVSLDGKQGDAAVYPDWDDGFEGCWTWGTDKARLQIDEIVAKEIKGNWKIYRKNYAEDEDGEATKQVKSIWTEKQFHTEKGQAVFNELFETKNKLFQSPKSVDTIKQVLQMASKKDSIVMDFFAGSSTTGHAVMELNAQDGGNRRFILVQIPEACDSESEAFKAGYSTIAEVSKERIRRAGKKVLGGKTREGWRKDIGFRLLKVDSSNMAEVFYNPDAISQDLLSNQIDSIKIDRTPEDLLFQVILDWGVDLAAPISRQSIEGQDVFFVDGNALVACFDGNGGINEDFVKELAKYQPLRAVFRDAGFKNSAVKINVEQIFKLLSPSTEVKCI